MSKSAADVEAMLDRLTGYLDRRLRLGAHPTEATKKDVDDRRAAAIAAIGALFDRGGAAP